MGNQSPCPLQVNQKVTCESKVYTHVPVKSIHGWPLTVVVKQSKKTIKVYRNTVNQCCTPYVGVVNNWGRAKQEKVTSGSAWLGLAGYQFQQLSHEVEATALLWFKRPALLSATVTREGTILFGQMPSACCAKPCLLWSTWDRQIGTTTFTPFVLPIVAGIYPSRLSKHLWALVIPWYNLPLHWRVTPIW